MGDFDEDGYGDAIDVSEDDIVCKVVIIFL